jgi:hypothetical protein
VRRFYFFCSRSTGDCFAVEPRSLYTCRLATTGAGRLIHQRATPQSLALGGLYKARRAHAWELEPLRQTLETDLKEAVRAYTTQPPSYIVHYIAGRRTDLEQDLQAERDRIAKKRRTNRRNNKARGTDSRATAKQRRLIQQQKSLAQSAIAYGEEE